ncbi:MAG: GAF domain-containing protein [Candidatus Limnocylindria bacterium]
MSPSRGRSAAGAGELQQLHRAALAIGGDLDLDRTLGRILRTAARLVGARYGALGIRDERGGFGTFIHVGIPRRRADLIGELPRLHGLLGTILREGKAVRLADIRDHPDFSYYPAHHPDLREFLGVPITHRGEVLGELYLSGTAAGRFTAADQDMVEMLAAHAGLAIATARLATRERELAALRERDRIAREIQEAVSRALVGMVAGARAAGMRQLSARELDVLRLMADGRSNKEIASDLGLSEKTVKSHVSSVLGKLGVADRTQAAVLAVRSGLVG